MEYKINKVERTLSIYKRLLEGKIINKTVEADKFSVDERSIQRDIDDIRNFMGNNLKNGIFENIVYDRNLKGYKMESIYGSKKMSNGEVLAVSKILMDSRAFNKFEMKNIIDKLLENCIPVENKKVVNELIKNEFFHYVELKHGKNLVDDIWRLGEAINKNNFLEIEYQRISDKKIVKRKIKPVGMIFSEFYFYITAYIEDDTIKEKLKENKEYFPTIYRIDRIKNYKILNEHFYIPYKDKFEEGEFRKRIQFMFAGKLERVKFKYLGNDLESVLDRLPTAKILENNSNYVILEAEVFGKGIDMWLRSQGERVEVLK